MPITDEGSETVLLVSAQADTRKLAAFMLEKRGYNVLEARDGSQAETLYAVRRDAIDLVLTDVAMPGMNGRDMISRFREVKPGLKVLFMAGSASPTGRELREKGYPVLEKPFTMRDLAGTVRAALDKPLVRAAAI